MMIYQLQTKCHGTWVTMQSFADSQEAIHAYGIAKDQDPNCEWQLVKCKPILRYTPEQGNDFYQGPTATT